jgi:hypothetical protein
VLDEVACDEHAPKPGYQQRFERPKDVQNVAAGVAVDACLEVFRGAGLAMQSVDLGGRPARTLMSSGLTPALVSAWMASSACWSVANNWTVGRSWLTGACTNPCAAP